MTKFISSIALAFVTFSMLAQHRGGPPLPPPGLEGQDLELKGKWVYLEGYCSDWTNQQKLSYRQQLKSQMFSEHLFIDGWHFKFIQNIIPEGTPKTLPYDFCYKSATHYSKSKSGHIQLSLTESLAEPQCQGAAGSPIEQSQSKFTYRYLNNIYGPKMHLMVRIFNESCQPGASWVSRYKKLKN